MAWTAPMTAVANSAFTAAQFNIHVRDNLNETAPAKATVAGRWFVSTGVNSIAERAIEGHEVGAAQTTTQTTAGDIPSGTVGPTVTLTTGTMAILSYGCQLENNSTGGIAVMTFAISGATTRAPEDKTAIRYKANVAGDYIQAGACHLITGLTAGSNTFTAKYHVGAGTGTFQRRFMMVMAL